MFVDIWFDMARRLLDFVEIVELVSIWIGNWLVKS